MRAFPLLLLFLCVGCIPKPNHPAYNTFYSHLSEECPRPTKMHETDYFLVVLVEARHLDYTDNRSFFKTLSKHPSDGSKNSDVGHAWVYVRGRENGVPVEIEGGHSGELGYVQPRYFEGVMFRAERCHPNPVGYLWESQEDGFFEGGGGYHRPTYAAKIDITQEQYEKIADFIKNYPYEEYSLTKNQCCTFVKAVAALADWQIDAEVEIEIEPTIHIAGETLPLWTDPCYSMVSLNTPDMVEKSLMKAVKEGRAEPALRWYNRFRPECWRKKYRRFCETAYYFPIRYQRAREFHAH